MHNQRLAAVHSSVDYLPETLLLLHACCCFKMCAFRVLLGLLSVGTIIISRLLTFHTFHSLCAHVVHDVYILSALEVAWWVPDGSDSC